MSILLTPCSGALSAQEAPSPVVLVKKVARESFRPSFEHPARIEAVQSGSVRPIIKGQITAIHFRAGDIVEEGQPLIEIDNADYEISVAEAEANLKQAEANSVKADGDLERARLLVQRETVSQRDLEFAQASSDVAQAQVEVAKARLAQSRKNLEDTAIDAPFAGRIGAPTYAVGDLFVLGDPTQLPYVATLVSLDPIYAVGLVDQSDYFEFLARRLRLEGQGIEIPPLELQILLPGGGTHDHTGKFENWDNTAVATTGSIAARILFPNPEGILLPGENVTVRGAFIQAIDTVLVPQRAVSYDQVGHYVWIVDGEGKAERRDVEVGVRDGGNWSIASGLEPGDTVIVEGVQKVRPGAAVTAGPWQV